MNGADARDVPGRKCSFGVVKAAQESRADLARLRRVVEG